MKTTINRHEFLEAFQAMRPENFSREGLNMLFEYLEQYEEDEHEAADMVAEALQDQTSVVGVTGEGAVVFQGF